MSRHHDKLIASATRAVRTAGQPPPRTEPRTQDEIESYLKGFGLPAPAVRLITAEWTGDITHARRSGYDSGYDDATDQMS